MMLFTTSFGILAILLFFHFLANKNTAAPDDGPRQIIASGNVNSGRQFEIDIAKAVSIIWMILVHVDEQSHKGIDFAPGLETWINTFIEFVGGPLGAPIFMIAMGIGMVYSKNQAPATNAARGISLIKLGYILNIARGTIPFLVFFMLYNDESLKYLSLEKLLCLDILQFAGLVFLFFALMKHLKLSDLLIAFAALALLMAGSIITPLYPDRELKSVWIGYFIYQNSLTPFPLFTWLIYPVVGYLFGKILLRVADKTKFYTRLLAAGVVLCGAFTAILLSYGHDLLDLFTDDNLYSQNTVKVLWILSIAAIWCGLLYFISIALTRMEPVKRLVAFMSKNINSIYITQWILIGWTTAGGFLTCAGYGGKFMPSFVSIAILTVVIVYFGDALKTWRKNRKQASAQS